MSRGQRIGILVIAVLVGIAFAIASPTVLQAIFERAGPGRIQGQNVVYAQGYQPANIFACGILGTIIGGVFARFLQRLLSFWLDKWDTMQSGDKINLFLSIFAGLFASTPILLFFNSLQQTVYLPFAFVGFSLGLSAASYFTLKIMGDSLPWNKSRGPAKRSGIKILDTNVLIDGRIYDVARTHFLEGPLYVPAFVLEELQYIADSHDALRRQRGRRGLDVLRHLQSDFTLDIGTHDRLSPDKTEEVDSRLVRLAHALGADIVTNDFNLNRVAKLQQVNVLNLNDLALAMRPNVLPSETLSLTVVREGNQHGQGVGYLEDGTMVVVEQGKQALGETVTVTVTQVIQTERGKMIFAEVREGAEEPNSDTRLRKPAKKV